MNKKILLGIGIIFLSLFILGNLQAITLKSVSSSPNEIIPGETAEVSLDFENNLGVDISDLRISLILAETPFAPYESSSEKYLDELRDNDEENFEFDLIALPQTEAGIYKIPVEISYFREDGNNTTQVTKQELISLTINSPPELKISFEDSVVLIKGKENILSLEIVNSGLSRAQFVYLTFNEISGIDFLCQKEQYLGDIDSDDFDNVECKVFVSKDTLSSKTIPITLSYKDATNKNYRVDSQIPLKTYSLQEAKEMGLVKRKNPTIWILIILVLGLYFIRRYFKKRKKRKE